VNGFRLHYWIGGNPKGIPVLLWHGFLGTAYSWHKVMPMLGVVIIQYCAQNIYLEPVFGAGALAVSPRVGYIHVSLDNATWVWADASGNPIILMGLPPGPHKVVLELNDANHQRLDKATVAFVVPEKAASCRITNALHWRRNRQAFEILTSSSALPRAQGKTPNDLLNVWTYCDTKSGFDMGEPVEYAVFCCARSSAACRKLPMT